MSGNVVHTYKLHPKRFSRGIRICVLTLLLGGCLSAVQAQPPSSVGVVTRSDADRILLKLFPTTPTHFNMGNRHGYIVERALVTANLPISKNKFQPIPESPLLRWKDEVWQKEIDQRLAIDSNQAKYAAFAQALSSGNGFSASSDVFANDLKSFMEERSKISNLFAYVALATAKSNLAAKGLGLWVEDRNVRSGNKYAYRIRINHPDYANEKSWTYLSLTCQPFDPNQLQKRNLIRVEEGDESVLFSFPPSDEYFTYDVYRSDEPNAPFQKINAESPVMLIAEESEVAQQHSYLDSNLQNYRVYQYKVLVTTPLSDQLLLGTFTAMPRDKTPPPSPSLRAADHTQPLEVTLNWDIELPAKNDLKGFSISRSNNEKTGYTVVTKTLLSPNDRKFIDRSFDPSGSNYYVVDAYDTAGNYSRSFPAYVTLIDSTPPAIPTIESAVMDSLGRVIIKMKPNRETDFMGYQLLKANAPDHDFSVVAQTFNDSTYENTRLMYDTTTLNTLTKDLYYQVIAFDTHFNQSESSSIVKLTRRDTIPPESPVITDYLIADTSIQFQFVNSGSEDASANYLLRRVVGKPVFDTIFVNRNSEVTNYTDLKIRAGERYEYSMVARDETGLYSPVTNVLLLKTKINNRLPAPTIKVSYNKDNNEVSLFIETIETSNAEKMMANVYCQSGVDLPWNLLAKIPFVPGKPYVYKLNDRPKELNFSVTLSDNRNRISIFSPVAKLIF